MRPLVKARGRPASPTEGADVAVKSIREFKLVLGYSDQDLASCVGIDQSSVHRALNRLPPAWTPSLQKIWNYVENSRRGARQSAEERLSEAAVKAWDGTPRGLERLLALLDLFRDSNSALPHGK